MSCHTFVEPILAKDAEGRCEAAFEIVPFGVLVVERRGTVQSQWECPSSSSTCMTGTIYLGKADILPWAMFFLTPGSKGAEPTGSVEPLPA